MSGEIVLVGHYEGWRPMLWTGAVWNERQSYVKCMLVDSGSEWCIISKGIADQVGPLGPCLGNQVVRGLTGGIKTLPIHNLELLFPQKVVRCDGRLPQRALILQCQVLVDFGDLTLHWGGLLGNQFIRLFELVEFRASEILFRNLKKGPTASDLMELPVCQVQPV
jgi:hypothetical protein